METIQTVYEQNKKFYKGLPSYSQELLDKAIPQIKNFLERYPLSSYFICVNNELRYYTLYHKVNPDLTEMAKTILEIMCDIGEIKSIETNLEYEMLEFWIEYFDDNEIHLFPIFDYSFGVVEV